MKNENEENSAQILKLSDTSIGMIRDLIQLSLLLGTNIIDNLRAMRFDYDPNSSNLLPNEDYVNAYNAMIVSLEAQLASVVASDQEEAPSVPETH